MSDNILHQLTLLFIFIGFFGYSNGIKCYHCNYWGGSSEDEKCTHSPPPVNFLSDCYPTQTHCEVFTAHANGKTYTDKKCAISNTNTNGCSTMTVNNPSSNSPVTGQHCFCSSDKCNAADGAKIHGANIICILILFGPALRSIMH